MNQRKLGRRVFKVSCAKLGMKIKRDFSLWSGIIIVILLLASFFVKIKVDSGANFVIKDSLLGILIFHNPAVFGFYILVVGWLVYQGISGKKHG